MKKIIAGLTFSLLLFLSTNAQSTVEQAKQRAITDVNNNTGTTIDKTVNGAFDQTGKAIGNIFKKKSIIPLLPHLLPFCGGNLCNNEH